jgi:hypothetical protein
MLIGIFDLQKLLDDKGFNILIKLAFNRLATLTVSLANTGANSVNFINT